MIQKIVSTIVAVIILIAGVLGIILLAMPIVHAAVIVGFSEDAPWGTAIRGYIIAVLLGHSIISLIFLTNWVSKRIDHLFSKTGWLRPDDYIDQALLCLYCCGLMAGLTILGYHFAIKELPTDQLGTFAIASCIASSIAILSWVYHKWRKPT
jgi:hypothetical protein